MLIFFGSCFVFCFLWFRTRMCSEKKLDLNHQFAVIKFAFASTPFFAFSNYTLLISVTFSDSLPVFFLNFGQQ